MNCSIIRILVLLALLLCSAAVAAAAEDPTATEIADAVVAAKDDPDELARLYDVSPPGRWRVADELCARGEHELAGRFAKSVDGPETQALVRAIERAREQTPQPKARAALHRAEAAIRERKPADALQVIASVELDDGSILALRRDEIHARALFDLNQFEEAGERYRAVAAAMHEAGWLIGAAGAEMRAAGTRANRGDLAGAMELYDRAAQTAEKAGSERVVAYAIGNKATLLGALGEFEQAMEIGDRVAKIAERSGDVDWYAGALINRANYASRLGRIAAARADYERSIEVMQQTGETLRMSAALINFGGFLLTTGELGEAFSVLEDALEISRDNGDSAHVVAALDNLARLAVFAGDLDSAQERVDEGMPLVMSLGNPRTLASFRYAAAMVRMNRQEHDAALELLEQALQGFAQVGDRPSVVLTLGQIGTTHHNAGDHERAKAVLEQTLATAGQFGMRGEQAAVNLSLALVYTALKEPEKGIAAAEAAQVYYEEVGDERSRAMARYYLGHAQIPAGRAVEAVTTLREAGEMMRRLAGQLSDRRGASTRATLVSLFQSGVAAATLADDREAAVYFLESGRAGALLESLGTREEVLAATLPPELLALQAEARRAEAEALAVVKSAMSRRKLREASAAKKVLESARREREALHLRIQREAKSAASVGYAEPASLGEIQAALQPGDVLVSYAFFSDVLGGLAMVVQPDFLAVVDLPRRDEVDAAAKAVDLESAAVDATPAIAALRKMVIEPLKLPEGTKRILVSPDGALCNVPFSVLCEDLIVTNVPSGTTYTLLLEQADLRGEGVLALGDPTYGERSEEQSANGSRAGWRLTPLPGTRVEAEAVGTKLLLGDDATEAGLKATLADPKHPRWRAVHLACHGIADTENPARSALAITAEGDDDGMLSVLDIFGMRVPTDLVVLSACETGRGRVVRAEGVMGLTRAFMFAGAPRVIVSQWKVDDQATSALMIRFYELWNAGTPVAEALKQAQQHVRSQEKWEHPRFWAAWVLWGLPE